ncbi:MAG: glycerophosphodiester phosphodiesterase [Bacteroidaceae bacterium]|nr:glycerophosphodiester phosphodiesterase [Bacteroidaceae bacterium]
MKRIFFALALACASLVMFAQPRVVAHRGYWRTEGSAQNSITSLQKAAAIGCYGSEFDVWITVDGVPVVFHDATINGIRIEDATYAELMNHRLANGEFIPTLQQYLLEATKTEGCQLILEIKPHSTAQRDERIVQRCLELIHMLKLQPRTEYISFSKHVCEYLHSQEPKAKIAYLNGDISPKDIKAMGLTGIDYHFNVFRKHPEWLQESQQLGVEVNVWTVDGAEALTEFANMQGIDIITTNDPEILQDILKKKR